MRICLIDGLVGWLVVRLRLSTNGDLEIRPRSNFVARREARCTHLHRDPEARASDRPLGSQTKNGLDEAPCRHNAQLHLALGRHIRFEQGFSSGGKRAVFPTCEAPAVVEGLDDGQLLTDAREEKLIWQDGVEELADFTRMPGRVGGHG